jgi:hypothetical protein
VLSHRLVKLHTDPLAEPTHLRSTGFGWQKWRVSCDYIANAQINKPIRSLELMVVVLEAQWLWGVEPNRLGGCFLSRGTQCTGQFPARAAGFQCGGQRSSSFLETGGVRLSRSPAGFSYTLLQIVGCNYYMSSGSKRPLEAETWTCSACTFINHPPQLCCSICGTAIQSPRYVYVCNRSPKWHVFLYFVEVLCGSPVCSCD